MLIEPYLSDFRNHLEQYEGRIPWMYLDGPGNVTAGIGHLIPTAAAATTLGFKGLADDDWARVKAAVPDKLADAYKILTLGRLDDAAIDNILAADIAAAYTGLQHFIPAVDSLPQACQQCLLDLSFNLGGSKLHAQYFGPHSKFGPAVMSGDWKTAAAESARTGIQPVRNQYAADLLLSLLPSAV